MRFPYESRTDEVLTTGWEALILSQVVEKVLNITRPRCDRSRGNEAIGLLRAIDPIPKFPRLVSNSGRRDLSTDRLNGPVLAQPKRSSRLAINNNESVQPNIPNHEFIVTTRGIVASVCRREKVIRHIGVDVGGIIAPFNGSGNATDVTNVHLHLANIA